MAALRGVTSAVIDTLTGAWPELGAHRSLVEQVVIAEEEGFDRTLRQGSRLLEAAIGRAGVTGWTRPAAETAFELYVTYGFPIDLTLDAAGSAGLTVDEERFASLLEEQQHRAADGWIGLDLGRYGGGGRSAAGEPQP
ncbi:MAG: alanine--tRNA ligase [Streptosporangiaceae bacterium]|nr:alanine--tRNA ligase [Streptosporangiaceae bacterium]